MSKFTNPEFEFQSTLPLRGVTVWFRVEVDSDAISIHTPLAGSDRRYTGIMV